MLGVCRRVSCRAMSVLVSSGSCPLLHVCRLRWSESLGLWAEASRSHGTTGPRQRVV